MIETVYFVFQRINGTEYHCLPNHMSAESANAFVDAKAAEAGMSFEQKLRDFRIVARQFNVGR